MRIKEILFLALLLTACTGQEKHYLPQEDPGTVVISDRVSNQRVNAFAEDADGHIWIGTFRGLNKYDDHEYHQYFCADDTTGLPDNRINCLHRSIDGKLWVATANGVAVRNDMGSFQRIRIPGEDWNISAILETSRGDLLFSNNSTLYRYVPEEETLRPVIREMNAFVPDLIIDQEDRLWVPTRQGIDCYETISFTKITSVPVPHLVYHMCYTGNGEIWMSGIGNIDIYDTRSMQWKDLPAALRNDSRVMDGDVDIIYSVDDRTILLHVIGVGMFDYYSTSEKVIFQDEAGFPFDLPDAEISSIFRDSRQNLWFGTADKGYSVSYHYKDQFNSNKYLTSFFSGKTVTSLWLEAGTRLWITTQTDGLFIYDIVKREIRPVDAFHLPANTDVGYIRPSQVFSSSTGDIWVLFLEKYQAVRCRFDGQRLHRIDAVSLVNPFAIREDDRGYIWIGGMDQALLRYDPRTRSTDRIPMTGDRGVAYVPGTHFYAAGGHHNTLRLNFSMPSVEQIHEGMRKLSDAIKTAL